MSFVVALLAVMMVHQYVTSTEETYRQRFGVEVSVVTASKDVRELDALDKTNLELKLVPKQFVQPGAVSKIEDFDGALAIAPVAKGEQVTRSKVTQLGTRTGLSRQVSVGKRAITVNVNDVRGVSRLIKPGDRVDIIAVINYGKGEADMIEVKTILQDVLVLATGKLVTNTVPGILEVDPNAGGRAKPQKVTLTEYSTYGSITVEVDPYDVQKLILVEREHGGVFLSLRNNDDNGREELETVALNDVLGPDSKRNRGNADVMREQARQRALQNQPVNRPPASTTPSPFGGGR